MYLYLRLQKIQYSKILIQNIDCSASNLQGPIMNYETSQAFLSIISMACEAILTCEKQLNKMDQKIYGNGDYGTNLARGAEAIKNAIQVSY